MAFQSVSALDPQILAYRVKDASRVSGIGVTSLYAFIKMGRLEKRKVGNMTLIPAASLRALIDNGAK